MNPRTGMAFIFSLLVFTSVAAAGTVKFYDGSSSFELENSTTVNINKTFQASNIMLYSNSIYFSGLNFTVTHNSSNSVAIDFFNSNPSAGDGSIAVNFTANTTDGHQVDFTLSGLKSDTTYKVERDGSSIAEKTSNSNGSISFSNSAWSRKNFGVRNKDESSGSGGSKGSSDSDDSDSGGSGGGSITTIGEEETKTYQKRWIVDELRTSYETGDMSREVGSMKKIEVKLEQGRTSFSIDVERLKERPEEVEKVDNNYSYFEIESSASDENISSTSILFSVNRSFSDKYDRIEMMRYDQNWERLETERINSTGEKTFYRAVSNGFSYYAISGRNIQQQETTDEEPENLTLANETGDEIQEPQNQTGDLNESVEKDERESNLFETVQKLRESLAGYGVLALAGLLMVSLISTGIFYRRRELEAREWRKWFEERLGIERRYETIDDGLGEKGEFEYEEGEDGEE